MGRLAATAIEHDLVLIPRYLKGRTDLLVPTLGIPGRIAEATTTTSETGVRSEWVLEPMIHAYIPSANVNRKVSHAVPPGSSLPP